jgi:SNF2 family DNA or RNA helicase
MATGGAILGKLKEFNKEYGKPIRDARCKSASSYVLKQGENANDKLQETLKPYLLRRLKMNCLKHELPPKREICVWVKPSNQQKQMYKEKVDKAGSITEKLLSLDKKEANKAKMGAFQLLAELKSLCGHPIRLLKGGSGGSIHSALEQTELTTIIQGSRKIELVIHMLKGFKDDSHKTLLFSQSTQNLDIIQYVLLKHGKISLCRIDG